MNFNLKKIVMISLPFLFIGGLVAYRSCSTGKDRSDDNPVPEKMKSSSVSVQACIAQDQKLVSSIPAVGTLLPNEEVDLTAESAGKVVEIYFKEGSRVKEGDLLLKVDDSDLLAQHQRASFQRKLLKEKLDRQRVLFEQEAVSREEYDQVQTDFNMVEADIALLDVKIAKTELRAPFDGLVGFREVSLGAYLQPGVLVSRLVDDNRLKVEFSIPEKYAGLPLVNAKVSFNIEASDKDFTATVYAVDPRVDSETRTIILRARCDHADSRLSAGMFARLNLITNQTEHAILLPTEAIVPEMGGRSVWKLENGKAKSVQVETGERTEDKIEILSGIEVGDTIVTTGLMQMRPGMPVVVSEIK